MITIDINTKLISNGKPDDTFLNYCKMAETTPSSSKMNINHRLKILPQLISKLKISLKNFCDRTLKNISLASINNKNISMQANSLSQSITNINATLQKYNHLFTQNDTPFPLSMIEELTLAVNELKCGCNLQAFLDNSIKEARIHSDIFALTLQASKISKNISILARSTKASTPSTNFENLLNEYHLAI